MNDMSTMTEMLPPVGAHQRIQQPAGRYVVGYCFSPDFDAVALIEKIKPTWQKGKLNGIGGKIEPGEAPVEAMRREFGEEATAVIREWLHIRTEWFTAGQEQRRGHPGGAQIFHFAHRATLVEWCNIRAATAERIMRVALPLRPDLPVIYNLPYLIPMAEILLRQPFENRPMP